jgi:hypothetical protein
VPRTPKGFSHNKDTELSASFEKEKYHNPSGISTRRRRKNVFTTLEDDKCICGKII